MEQAIVKTIRIFDKTNTQTKIIESYLSSVRHEDKEMLLVGLK